MKTLLIALAGIAAINAVPVPAQASAYWNGYDGWVDGDDCGPRCQARRDERRREEFWRERHWREWHHDHPPYLPPYGSVPPHH